MFPGVLWVSARLRPGGTDLAGGWQDQLEKDIAPLRQPGDPVWVGADNAYYRGRLVSWLIERGWDASISLTNPRHQAPLLCIPHACEFADEDWQALDPQRDEEALLLYYQPSGWQREGEYVVIRRTHEGG